MAIQLDDVNTVVTKEITPGVVDGYFKAGPVIAMAKARFTRKWICGVRPVYGTGLIVRKRYSPFFAVVNVP